MNIHKRSPGGFDLIGRLYVSRSSRSSGLRLRIDSKPDAVDADGT